MSAPVTPTLLYLDNITVSFDGFRALNALSLAIDHAEMRAIIGPNGAGKTTMMDVITGKSRPTQGAALFEGLHDLTALDEAAIAELGIGRKFQTPTVFEMHSVEDNLLLSVKNKRDPFSALFSRRTSSERERIDALLERVRLSSQRYRKAGELSHGQKQWLEIGMLLAQEPKLLLIDEPAAGMTDQETADTADLLREIAKTKAVVVVEHDMSFVRDLGVKVTCLHEGSVLAEGSLDAVSSNERVIEVYLGR
ncbi:urea ABC transporter ATP-binding protein UrtD [Microvirga sp. ACRRW]|uniref:urea ABC transporter ATP-binding protein UrtD n=1 Tax=Microvirga sp. ACRRW TaxID=2918205 RepID=UPI001EF57207|nr:urea ABC transporter ATP-binding protein UrtD [Microvirga sp. ACRRW]MCG7391524.1 urea ABC transporter ATP-binding protein UrtD [Microvirga sp. ACRRW]